VILESKNQLEGRSQGVAGRRRFTADYKRRILDEAGRAGHGEIGLKLLNKLLPNNMRDTRLITAISRIIEL